MKTIFSSFLFKVNPAKGCGGTKERWKRDRFRDIKSFVAPVAAAAAAAAAAAVAKNSLKRSSARIKS